MKVTYIDHMGTDLTVVNAARVSFGKKSEWVEKPVCWEAGSKLSWDGQYRLSKADQSLIAFLARGCTTGEWDCIVDELLETGVDFKLLP